MTDENKEKPVVGTNPMALPWPQDPQGALKSLKAGGIEAARRVNGNEDKMRKLLTTLDIIREHAIAKYKVDVGVRRDARQNAVAAKARVEVQRRKVAEDRALKYEQAAKETRKQAGIE